ncbi:hypothetical protein R6Q57_018772 [Mikania cordata]
MFEGENSFVNEVIDIGERFEEDYLNDYFEKLDEEISNEVLIVGDVNPDDSFFNPIAVDSLEACYLFFEMLEEPKYVVKYKRQLQRQIVEVIEWFFIQIGQPDKEHYPPMLPNGEEVELLDLYMFVKVVGGYNNVKWPGGN